MHAQAESCRRALYAASILSSSVTTLMLSSWAAGLRDMTEEHSAPPPNETAHRQSAVSSHALHPPLRLRVFEQLKQRNVFRVAILYLVVCWLILEPVHVIFHMLEVPVWHDRLVIMIVALGFPAVTIFAWVYEITPEGLKPTAEIPHGQSIRRQTGRRIDRAIIVVLIL